MNIQNAFSFLTIGKTVESTEASEGFKRYVGLASSHVLAVNPDKKTLDELMGYESQNEPEYVREGENGKEAIITFIVRTDPETNNGIEITQRLTFTLRNQPDYSRDGSTVRVIDPYGNYTRANTEDAKAGNALPANYKIDQTHYRMACVGECDLVDFLKKYLGVPSSLNYVNGSWVLSEKAADGRFGLDEIKNYFHGDVSELRKALDMQPNNKIKLLYGVRTNDEGRQYQAVCSRGELMARNNAGSNTIEKLRRDLANAKNAGSYASIEYVVQPLQEYEVKPTNLEAPAPATNTAAPDFSTELPW